MRAIVVFACAVAGACNGVEDQTENTQEVVTTDLTTYTQGQTVIVTYNNMQGATTDWIALSRTTDNDDVYWAWQYTGGGTSGTATFTNPGLTQGTYEARAYYDWAGTSSYTVQQRSAPFMVTGNAMLAATQSSYAAGSPVTINYSGFSGSTTDWISIHSPGSADENYIDWQYTGGGMSGSLTFNNLPTGTWEARYHANFAGTQSFASSATSPQFSIGASPSVSTDQLSYGAGQTVTVSYANLPGNPLDYVAVSTAGAPPNSTVQRFYTNGQINGSQQFTGLAPGNYEARAYANDSTSAFIASSTFTVGNASVTTDASMYATTDTVTVTYSGMPGNPMDWIAIAQSGSPDSQYVQFVYTNGMAMGTAQFSNLPAGTYEARAYLDNSFTVLARSATFVVGQACTVPAAPPVFESLTSGDATIGSNAFTIDVPMTVATDRSILFTSMREREGSPQFGAVKCDLHPADAANGIAAGITCYRNQMGTDTAGSSGAVTIHWTVVTFMSGVTVQRGSTKTYPTNPATVTLSPAVDPTTSFVLLNGMLANGTGWGSNEFVRARLASGTSLELSNAVVGSETTWQVVTMSGASVQRGTTSLATGTTTQTVGITAAPSGSMILASYTSDNGSSIGASNLMLNATFSGATSIFFERGAGGSTLDVSWEVVSLPFSTRLGNTLFNAGVGARTESVPGIAGASSVAISSVQSILGQSGGWSLFNTTDIVGEAATTMTTGAGSVLIQRASTTERAMIPWTVIDFAHDCAGN
jgi:hypothetical protein